MGNALRFLCGQGFEPCTARDSDSLGPLGVSAVTIGVSAPAQGVEFELHTLPVGARGVVDGDGINVFVSTSDPRESCLVPLEVQVAALERSVAHVWGDKARAKELHKSIIAAGYRLIDVQNEEVLARKYRIRLRGIDAPEAGMPYGKEAKEELAKIVQGKCLRVHVYNKDRYDRCVGDVYCDGIFVQELMLKRGMAWHYKAYDQRAEFAEWEENARAERKGLWASPNPEKPWEWRRKNRRGGDNVYQNLIIQSFAIPGKRSWPCVEIKGYNLLETFQFI